MLNRRSLFAAFAAAALSTPFFASGALAASSTPVIRVGINPGGQAEIMEVVKKNAEKLGLQIKVFEFSDYIAPNVALDTGDIDINSFQHQPYLDRQIKDRHYKIESVAKTIISPLVFFTNKGYKSFKDIPNGSKIAIPNDATNEGRALLILQNAGYIKLRPGSGLQATPLDIVSNPKKLKFVEIEAPQLPRSLDDTTASVINAGYAFAANLTKKDQIVAEDNTSPYVNIIAVKKGRETDPSIVKYIEIFHTEPVKKFIEDKYKGQVVPAW